MLTSLDDFFDHSSERLNLAWHISLAYGSSLHAGLQQGDLLNVAISQGSVATSLRYGGIFNDHSLQTC